MINTMKKVYPTPAIYFHCGTWATMNILNYFWWTTFGYKDTYDVETMIRFWHFSENERPNEDEICYFLAQMNFKVEFYSKSSWENDEDFELYLNDRKKHQEKYWYEIPSIINMETSTKALKNLINHKNYTYTFDENLDLEKLIREKSDWKHMFLFWLDWYKLYWIEDHEWFSWHIVASIGYEGENDKLSIIETSPWWEIFYKSYEEIVDAIKFRWNKEYFYIISLNKD